MTEHTSRRIRRRSFGALLPDGPPPRDDHDTDEFWRRWREGQARQHDHLHPVRVAERTTVGRMTPAARVRAMIGSTR